ncbi:hypothetical protein MMC28_007399 [Mycoblastus sanguinarius]|nr:hypothetical protein [Mycoblastus sanguinarius]
MSTASNHPPTSPPSTIPLLLLKSASPNPPLDAYTKHFTSTYSHTYAPHFVPVLTHTLLPDPLIKLLLTHLTPNQSREERPLFPYGALIFTSQRAVAAFASALNAPPVQRKLQALSELRLRLYTVGPATASSLLPVRDKYLPLCGIYGGEEAGSGEVLAGLMLGKGERGYNSCVESKDGDGRRRSMLFLTGEKRRDVIPRTLMAPELGDERIQVDEMVVYQSGELEDFEFHFQQMLVQTEPKSMQEVRWVVVFSPTAGKGMLRGLGWLDEGTGRLMRDIRGRKTYVACIGPTTREYFEKEFGFVADVTAAKPSPEGVRRGIERFMEEKEL